MRKTNEDSSILKKGKAHTYTLLKEYIQNPFSPHLKLPSLHYENYKYTHGPNSPNASPKNKSKASLPSYNNCSLKSPFLEMLIQRGNTFYLLHQKQTYVYVAICNVCSRIFLYSC